MEFIFNKTVQREIVVEAKNKEEALEKIEDGDFEDRDVNNAFITDERGDTVWSSDLN